MVEIKVWKEGMEDFKNAVMHLQDWKMHMWL